MCIDDWRCYITVGGLTVVRPEHNRSIVGRLKRNPRFTTQSRSTSNSPPDNSHRQLILLNLNAPHLILRYLMFPSRTPWILTAYPRSSPSLSALCLRRSSSRKLACQLQQFSGTKVTDSTLQLHHRLSDHHVSRRNNTQIQRRPQEADYLSTESS